MCIHYPPPDSTTYWVAIVVFITKQWHGYGLYHHQCGLSYWYQTPSDLYLIHLFMEWYLNLLIIYCCINENQFWIINTKDSKNYHEKWYEGSHYAGPQTPKEVFGYLYTICIFDFMGVYECMKRLTIDRIGEDVR